MTHHAKALAEYRERELAVLAELEQQQLVAKYGGTPRPVDVSSEPSREGTRNA